MTQLRDTISEPRRCAFYLRCSSEKGHTDAQRPAVEQIAKARGFQVVATFAENASALKHRPEWDKLKSGAHRGDFDVVVIAAIDRLGRSMVGNVQEILWLDKLGIEVVSVREPWLAMDGPARTLLIAILSWLGEEERRQIASRSRAGVERARKLGTHIGRPAAVVDLDEARRLRGQGLSLRKAAAELGVPTSVLHRALRGVPEVPLNRAV
jgi:putative DNA-invertase from lambdoid prophage Rac